MGLNPDLVKTPDTDEWWMVRLGNKLAERLPRVRDLEAWMDGNPPIANPDADASGAFDRVRRFARLNLAELIVNAVLYRMQVLTFRTAAEDDQNGDREANKILKANDFPVMSAQAIEWMLTLADSYLICGPRDYEDPSKGILMTAEHPDQVITEDDPMNPGQALAALKIYRDDLTNSDVAVLYRKDYIRVARREGKNSILPTKETRRWNFRGNNWTWDEPTPYELETGDYWTNDEGNYVTPTHTEYPPVFHLRNRGGKGEFEKHLNTLERINHTILQRMIIIAFQAFRQRGVKGVPNTDKDGQEIDYRDIFASDPGAVWILPETADFWESGQADIGPVLTAVKDDIIHLAVSSSTPLFSVVPDAANGSAEGAALQREGLIFKTEACIKLADSAFCRAMSAAFAIAGDEERADVSEITSVWASPRRSSLQERATAAVQAKVAGVPWRTLMEKFVELTPDEIAAAEQERLQDAFMQSLLGPQEDVSIPGMTDPPRSTV